MKSASPSTGRSAKEIRAADRRAAARKFKVGQVPTPALQAAIDAEKRGEFEIVADPDAWFRRLGLRK